MLEEQLRLILAAVLILAAAPLAAAEPVRVGGNDGLDACMTLGAVTGLKRDGDNFLAVREGPGTRFPKIDELPQGYRIWLCDEKGGWIGIVYGHPNRCGVDTPMARRQAYKGPCASGWVSAKYVKELAG